MLQSGVPGTSSGFSVIAPLPCLFFCVGLTFLVAGMATSAVNQMFLIVFHTNGRQLL